MGSGHVMQDIEEHKSVTVTVSKCVDCGQIELTWHK